MNTIIKTEVTRLLAKYITPVQVSLVPGFLNWKLHLQLSTNDSNVSVCMCLCLSACLSVHMHACMWTFLKLHVRIYVATYIRSYI